MLNPIIKGRVYLRVGDSSLLNDKAACTVFEGTFTASSNTPFYFLNYDDNTLLPNIDEICHVNRLYSGIIYLLEAPAIAIPQSRKTQFKFTSNYTYVRTARNLVPLSNLAYALYEVKGVNYVAIPYGSTASIEYDLIV